MFISPVGLIWDKLSLEPIGLPPAADKKIKLIPKIGGAEVIPDNHTKIAEGKVFVTGVLTEVVAIRPK